MPAPEGTILITGGTGKVGSCIAKLCQTSSTPYLVASRSASSATAATVHPMVKFDWLDRTTWSNPFITATKTSQIAAVYLISPPVPEASSIMNDFIDLARKEYGVKRFVLQYAPLPTLEFKGSVVLCSQGTARRPSVQPSDSDYSYS